MTNQLKDLILYLRKGPKQKVHESESVCFLVWALPEVQNQFQKQILLEILIYLLF